MVCILLVRLFSRLSTKYGCNACGSLSANRIYSIDNKGYNKFFSKLNEGDVKFYADKNNNFPLLLSVSR